MTSAEPRPSDTVPSGRRGPVDEATFKATMARFPTGVTVVTTTDANGQNWGFTASAFTSLSVDPPMVLLCLSVDAECAAAFSASDGFAVSILGLDGAEIAGRFARKGADKFRGVDVEFGAMGNPILTQAIAFVECETVDRVPGGDHSILIGRVTDAQTHDGEPLVYSERRFHRLARFTDI